MARYMGGPRCRRDKFRRRATMLPPGTFRQTKQYEEDDEGWEQSEDEVPDSDDIGSSSQEQPTVFKGKNGHGAAFDDEDGSDGDNDSDSDSESSSLGSGFEYPFPGLHGREQTNNAVSDNEPRLKRARSMSIPIYPPNPFSTGMLTYQPPPLPISYGWMVRGTVEHIEDLHLSGIPVCSKAVRSKTQIQVLGEYTWIETTPSQEKTFERFPAIYVPGNARTWRPVQIDSSLHQKEIQSIVNQKIRDDNAHRQPRYPFEPALRALEAADKVTSLSEIDIVTDTDTLTQLLSFIMGDAATRRVKEPFRLELKTVRNTLFIHPSYKPGSSQTGPPNKKTRHDPSISPPDWAPGVLGHIGTRAARLPYSGGHYRLVRYRFGNVVLAVRVKVDFVYQHRNAPRQAQVDPLSDVQPVFLPRQEGDVAQIWKTTVKQSGLGTRPAAAGITSVRYTWQDQRIRMKALLPHLWFSRTPFVIDCKASYPDLAVKEAELVNARQWYRWFERGHENSLRRLAGLLKHLQGRTREMGGDIVLIADPSPVYFVLLKPMIAMQALPEDLVVKFWGPDTEKEERERLAEMGRDSTPEDANSDLTDLSSTPSLPSRSEIPSAGHGKAGRSQLATPSPDEPQAHSEAAPGHIRGGSASTGGTQLSEESAEENDPNQMVMDWNNAVETPVEQSIEEGGASGYEASPAYNLESSLDGNRSSSQDSIMAGESAQEAGNEGSDKVLDSLLLQMNRPRVKQESHESLVAVARTADAEVLRGQHSLLMVDRHLTSGMHESSDDEWPPRPPVHPHGRITNAAPDMPRPPRHAHGDMELRSIRSGSFVPSAETPPGPYNADVDSEGHVVPRGGRRRPRETDSDDDDDEEEEPSPAHRRRKYHTSHRANVTASGRPRLSDGRHGQRSYIEVSNDADAENEDEDEDEEMATDEPEQVSIEYDDNNDGADDEGAWN
ncbi:hypothetical protein KVR01_009366 [Diaporthe batatas]|uniref:uncharacterized protein n=1 Tax=Diaporthe batatas TaxID=748121 RepID=UPI001D04181E|nr:uncharacterized protein KVR01_009366 [Diaporthe batatas]KAG8161102.1 hypothetical protein KVR01_009366 [Diaporthe batatas]